ncbi:SGNH/GDSL hydrolase family protein [Kitasatospora nipponensis]|uniref:SGNH/GDSL hydrolase family protein n=1 Tax=Kitasatospora nipponensis TaxID=258049 RepID=A0ABN1WE87_9ACTN
MRTRTKSPAVRRLAAAAVALGSSLAFTVPVGSAAAAPADVVPTVFFGDSYTADYGIAPFHEADSNRLFCFQAKENYPAVATRGLAEKGITLDVQSDVSCSGALVRNFWEEQETLPGSGLKVPAQQDALKHDTRLVVGSLGGNTLGFTRVLKQCSDKLRSSPGALLPGTPVDADQPAATCGEYFSSGGGKKWLDAQFELVGFDLEEMLDRTMYFAPDAKRVLVGYPRLVPADTTKCMTAAPGQSELPFADIPKDALPVLDQIQKRLNDVMRKAAADSDGGAGFVDLYAQTGGNTACDGTERGIGGLLEDSQLKFGDQALPWYAHPNEKGRDIQAQRVTDKVAETFGK